MFDLKFCPSPFNTRICRGNLKIVLTRCTVTLLNFRQFWFHQTVLIKIMTIVAQISDVADWASCKNVLWMYIV